MVSLITSILAITLKAGTSLVYATIGEIYTERSGILNLGLEGMMLMGAVSSFAVAYHTGSLLLAVLTAMMVGMVLAAVHAFLSITMRANQVVSGLSITLFGTGFASFLGQRLGPESNNFYLTGMNAVKFTAKRIPGLADLPIAGAVFNQDILTYIVFLLIPIAWIYMYKTKYGLNLRAVGENTQTADAMGIPVAKIRYFYTIVGGMLVGLGGAHLTGGRGWIVIALVIFSMWNPSRAILGAILFGGINAVQFRLQASGTDIPAAYLNMAPYIATILVLVLVTVWESHNRKVGPPAALGTSYMREDK
jgi:simple sugar transport system permease protein